MGRDPDSKYVFYSVVLCFVHVYFGMHVLEVGRDSDSKSEWRLRLRIGRGGLRLRLQICAFALQSLWFVCGG